MSILTNRFTGRLGRTRWCVSLLAGQILFAVALGATFLGSRFLSDMIAPRGGGAVAQRIGGFAILLLAAANTVFVLSLHLKRLRDVGKPARWLLLFLVPFFNTAFLVYLFARKGSSDNNRSDTPPASKKAAVAAMLILFLLLSIAPVAAETTSNGTPTIRAIIPDKGGARDVIALEGEGFGNDGRSVAAGYRYVRVGGFINTTIVSWNDTAIVFLAPALHEALSDATRLNLFWLIADAASVKLLSFAAKLFDAATSPLPPDVATIVPVTVILSPLRESNTGLFTYAATSTDYGNVQALFSIAYDTYGKDIVGFLRDPRELAQRKIRETMRGIQETPFFLRDLFTGQNPSEGNAEKPKNCDFSFYQIVYREPKPPIEAVRNTMTSLNIGEYSAVNSGDKTIIEIRGNETKGPLTKNELDTLNRGLARLGMFEPQIFNSRETVHGVCGRPEKPLILQQEDMEKLWRD